MNKKFLETFVFLLVVVVSIISVVTDNTVGILVVLGVCMLEYLPKKIVEAINGCSETNTDTTIDIKYHNKELKKIDSIEKGDWIDLRSAETVSLKKGEFKIISLGVGMKLPDGYEAHIVPRSSTYKNFKIIQTNSCGIIDNSYSGDSDVWGMPVIAMEDTVINLNDRICQFRIVEKMKDLKFNEVDKLDSKSRGGFGSTGIK